jgi:hypothetical protein
MRASSLCLLIIVQVIVASLAHAESAADTSPDKDASCRIPFERLKDTKTGESFSLSAALNENDKLPDHLRGRYIVADLSTTDEKGDCRGVQEHFTPVGELSEFPRLRAIAAARGVDFALLAGEPVETLLASEATPGDPTGLELELEDLKNYLQQVQRYKSDPVVRQPVFNGYCLGQTLNLCEIVNGQPKLVYRFVTSSARWRPPLYRYYAPINFIKSRSWSSDRRYTPADARRDARMGGGSAGIVPFANGGRPIEMPNFLHFLPMPGYVGEKANGIHQIAGGLDSGGRFGAPSSLGCIRLGRFQAKLARWWTPTLAKFFVHFEPSRYHTYGIASTGKARGFQTPRPEKIETVSAKTEPTSEKTEATSVKTETPSEKTETPSGKTETASVTPAPVTPPPAPVTPPPSRPKKKSAPLRWSDTPLGLIPFSSSD